MALAKYNVESKKEGGEIALHEMFAWCSLGGMRALRCWRTVMRGGDYVGMVVLWVRATAVCFVDFFLGFGWSVSSLGLPTEVMWK